MNATIQPKPLQVVYHQRSERNGWQPIRTQPTDAPDLDPYDLWAIRHMIDTGAQTVTLGWNMWELRPAQ